MDNTDFEERWKAFVQHAFTHDAANNAMMDAAQEITPIIVNDPVVQTHIPCLIRVIDATGGSIENLILSALANGFAWGREFETRRRAPNSPAAPAA